MALCGDATLVLYNPSQIMAEVIAKSKMFKEQRQRQKAEDEENMDRCAP
jgi:hypothetical protein